MPTPELTTSDLQQILRFTVKLSRTAGDLILEGSQMIISASDSDVNEKKNSVDLVTEYDVKVEELVRSEIEKTYPDFEFIGEESFSSGLRPALTDTPTFCVDPIDGTTNFVHGFPYACISIGLIYKRRPVLGVIYNPFLDQLYTGISGQGSHLTRGSSTPMKLPLSSPSKTLSSLSKALIAVEWGSDRCEKTISSKSTGFARLTGNPEQGIIGGKMAHSLRLVLFELFIIFISREIGCWPWDVCAGIVIAEEAGGVVSGSHEIFAATVSTDAFGDVTEAILTGRKYIVVRAIAGNLGETGADAQKRIIREFYDSVEDVSLN